MTQTIYVPLILNGIVVGEAEIDRYGDIRIEVEQRGFVMELQKKFVDGGFEKLEIRGV